MAVTAKKKAPARKVATKKAPVKKAAVKQAPEASELKKATKKAPVKKASPKKAAVKSDPKPKTGRGPGRPPGPAYVPEWIEVMGTSAFSRKNALDPKPGLGSVNLKAGEDGAVALEKLADLIREKDARLLKLLK